MKTPAERLGSTKSTRDSTIAKKLKEVGYSDSFIKGYLRGWNNVKEKN